MKRIIKLEGLCCANCAAKIETGAKKMDGVREASLSFMTQRLTLEVVDERVDAVTQAIQILTRKIEPDVEFRVLR